MLKEPHFVSICLLHIYTCINVDITEKGKQIQATTSEEENRLVMLSFNRLTKGLPTFS